MTSYANVSLNSICMNKKISLNIIMSRFSLTPAEFNNTGTHNLNDKSSIAGYGYYNINISKYSVADVEKEWGKILNLAKSFPGFIEGKLMFPTTPLYIQDPNNVGVFVANVVAYGRWKTKKDDHRWVEKALHDGWGFNNLHPTHKVHVTMLEK